MSGVQKKVIVIGGGPGGYSAAIRAAQLGAAVTLVERADIGGTCLNRGCMPTKALLRSAEAYGGADAVAELGVRFEGLRLDWAQVQKNRTAVISKLTGGVRALLRANKIELRTGSAKFVSANTVAIDGETLYADRVIIASGSRNAVAPIAGASESAACIDSDACLTLDSVPASLAVIGGGIVGLELGYAYALFGAKVSVFEKAERILPTMDEELSDMLCAKLRAAGLEIYTSCCVEAIDGGRLSVTLDGEEKDFEFEKILLCTGRKPNVEALCLNNAGVKCSGGFVDTNDRLETSAKGVYAVGDVTGKLMYAHAAIAMGELAAENAMGASRSFDAAKCPYCAYIGPELAGIGHTEQQLKARGVKYKTGRFPTAANGRCLVMGCTDGIIKVLTGEKYGEILGVHIMAPNAAELIAEVSLALRLEATSDEMGDTVHCHPTVSEALREAFLAADGKAIHIPNRK